MVDTLLSNALNNVNLRNYKCMMFHTHKKVHMISETRIERVQEFNFRELTLHDNLSWKNYINKLSNKISNSMGITLV